MKTFLGPICLLTLGLCLLPASANAQAINLPSSKQILPPVPGQPQRLNSLPMQMATSPDKRYVAIVNAGYGTADSDYAQSIAIVDRTTGKLTDFPEHRTVIGNAQTLYSGLAFSADGKHLYASLDSLSVPEGGTDKNGKPATGNAIAVYTFTGGTLTPERLLPIPLQKLAPGHTQNQIGKPIPAGMAIPAPTGLATVPGTQQLLIADEFSDDVLLLDTVSGNILKRFDLAHGPIVPGTYPIAVTASRDGRRAFVALWNGSAVAELDLQSGRVTQTLPLLPAAVPTAPSSHPTALELSPDGTRLYVALANRDSIAAIDLGKKRMKLAGLYDTRLPGQQFYGAIPTALALSPDGHDLYAANSGSNAVAVFHTAQPLRRDQPTHAAGFIPTEWFPTAIAVSDGKLLIATAKGKGTGPNKQPQPPAAHPDSVPKRLTTRAHAYIATLLYGSLASVDLADANAHLQELSAAVVQSNRMNAAQTHLQFANGTNPIKHVIYIIKENRTYDQILGDLGVGDGDPSLTMYGAAITPNQHKLAQQFGVLDNFYDSGEVSGDGHVWSNAAITSDYNEKNWQQSYRGAERMYDFEGVVAQGYPLQEGFADINEPASSYLWTDLARHNKSLYHFGEYISTKFCDDSGEAPKDPSPLNGTPEPPRQRCPRSAILPGEAIPANYGGGTSPYPWHIPLIYKNVATKPELANNFDPDYPDFNLNFPDQLRMNEFQTHLDKWKQDRDAGHDTMPSFVMLRFGNDHTAGTRPGSPTPRASVADNDLAVGRAVEAVSNSAFWNDTAFFILEDDAQDGADHVDAHRSIALVVSKYSPRNGTSAANTTGAAATTTTNATPSASATGEKATGSASASATSEKTDGNPNAASVTPNTSATSGAASGTPFIDHNVYTTVSVLRTMEDLLGIPPMNNNDAFAPLMQPLFTGTGDQPAFTADYTNRDNKLIYTANTEKSPGAKQSSKMDFTHEDQADTQKLNAILWRDAMGNTPLPPSLRHPKPTRKDEDDD